MKYKYTMSLNLSLKPKVSATWRYTSATTAIVDVSVCPSVCHTLELCSTYNDPPIGTHIWSIERRHFQLGMLTGTRVPGTRIYYPNPESTRNNTRTYPIPGSGLIQLARARYQTAWRSVAESPAHCTNAPQHTWPTKLCCEAWTAWGRKIADWQADLRRRRVLIEIASVLCHSVSQEAVDTR